MGRKKMRMKGKKEKRGERKKGTRKEFPEIT